MWLLTKPIWLVLPSSDNVLYTVYYGHTRVVKSHLTVDLVFYDLLSGDFWSPLYVCESGLMRDMFWRDRKVWGFAFKHFVAAYRPRQNVSR